MWINKALFDTVLIDNKRQQGELVALSQQVGSLQALLLETRTQKGKDDLHIDWLRHRVNALEKQNSILVAKVAGVHFPVPEIVPVRPGSMTETNFDSMPSFEDCGDSEAARLGVAHDESGSLIFQK